MVQEILPRLYRLVIPLPGNPLKEVNSFVFTSEDRNLIVDTGMNRPECREALEAGLQEIGVDLERTDFIATHYHADHMGLIGAVSREGARAYMGALDVRVVMADPHYWTEAGPMGRYAVRSGFPTEVLKASLRKHPGFKYGPTKPVHYLPLEEGQIIPIGEYHLRVVTTPGHTEGHVCLYEPNARFLISGDHVLGDITPNLQAWSDDRNPLGDYLVSLQNLNALDVALCLPGHRSLIQDLGRRIDELVEHHRQRANEVISILEERPRNAYDTAADMTWDIDVPSWDEFPIVQRWFATGEAIAHLRYLEVKGLIQRQLIDGQNRYSTDGMSWL
jgi:glyoxylase-like metal-dependent hydrolase (beta-lactamase superfamily II)